MTILRQSLRLLLPLAGAILGVVIMMALIHSPTASASKDPVALPDFGRGMYAATVNYPNCRFGAGGNAAAYPVAELNVGWHTDWSSQLSPVRPNGAEYVHVVRLRPDLVNGYAFTPETATLQLHIDHNPGATWLIGNEPDSPWQDNLKPETYARAYHHLYTLIKQSDPSARVGAGGIVQPTPIRLQYLDMALNTYRQLYGEPLPTDLWNIHTYILSETTNCGDGACIPPGITATQGVVYKRSEMFSTAIFRQRLIDFRVWMSDRGYHDVPLYITEYGELFPYPPDTPGGDTYYYDENGVPITEQRVAEFMTGTFDVLLGLIDPALGYPTDDNRLVQRWLWYSLDSISLGGALYDPFTHERRLLGSVFASYTQAISPSVDLLAVRVWADPAALDDIGQPQTTTLRARISNVGNVSITSPITVAYYAGMPPTGTLIGSRRITSALSGCGGVAEVNVTWSISGAGAHPMVVVVDPGDVIVEASNGNNTASGFALIATQHVYLPNVTRSYSTGP